MRGRHLCSIGKPFHLFAKSQRGRYWEVVRRVLSIYLEFVNSCCQYLKLFGGADPINPGSCVSPLKSIECALRLVIVFGDFSKRVDDSGSGFVAGKHGLIRFRFQTRIKITGDDEGVAVGNVGCSLG